MITIATRPNKPQAGGAALARSTARVLEVRAARGPLVEISNVMAEYLARELRRLYGLEAAA